MMNDSIQRPSGDLARLGQARAGRASLMDVLGRAARYQALIESDSPGDARQMLAIWRREHREDEALNVEPPTPRGAVSNPETWPPSRLPAVRAALSLSTAGPETIRAAWAQLDALDSDHPRGAVEDE